MKKPGETNLFGGESVDKDTLRVESYGILDELNCFLGLARSQNSDDRIEKILKKIQNDIFYLGADLASLPEKKALFVSDTQIKEIEDAANEVKSRLEELTHFIIPGGCATASYLQVARAVCRRAERRITLLAKEEPVSDNVIAYVNRLSNLLFELARLANKINNVDESEWIVKK